MIFEKIVSPYSGNIFYGYYDSNNIFILHRDEKDGPAIVSDEKRWYRNDRLHREDGPAIVSDDGSEEWLVYDTVVTDKVEEWFKERNIDKNNMTDEDKLALRFFMRSL